MSDPVQDYRDRPTARNDLADHPTIQGFDLGEELSASQLLQHMAGFGFQASELAKALEIIKAMRREKSTVFLGYTSNQVSSGNRELIRYLVEHEYVDAVVTTAGGIEEDIIKCFGPFKLGNYRVPGKILKDEAIHRIGNIWVPTDRYNDLDQFLTPLFDEVFSKQDKIGVAELLEFVGQELDHDESILTWAARNDIPVICPAVHDGAFGDILYFRTHQNKDITLDIAWESKKLIDMSLNADKTGAIVLGGGVAKHFIMNANILRDGLDYLVNINTAQEFDGSDSGGHPQEAVTWMKLQDHAMFVKVHCEATIAFPILASAWMSWERTR